MMTVCAPQSFIIFSNRDRMRERETEGVKRRERQTEMGGMQRAPGSLVCSVMICGVMNFQTLCIKSVTLRIALTVSDFCPVSVR